MAGKTDKVDMASLTSELKEFAIKVGAETVGVAPIERFAPAPLGFKPTDVLPGAQSVVAFIVPQLAGYCEHVPNNSYTQFGYKFKNLLIDRIAWEIARFLDNYGYWALPYAREGQTTAQVEGGNPNPFFERNYKPTDDNLDIKVTLRGDLSMRKAAEAAGLGRIGNSGLLLTPECGPRHRIGLCITTAKLEPTPVIEEDLCQHCLGCARLCPAEAITEKGPPEFNPVKCIMTVQRWANQSYKDALRDVAARRPNVWDEESRLRRDAVFVVYNNIVGTGLCGAKCVNPCPVGKRDIK